MTRQRTRISSTDGPFKALKGLSATKGQSSPPPAASGPPNDAADDPELFAREMALMKVRPVDGRDGAADQRALFLDATADAFEQAEAAEFLAAVETVDRPPRDDAPSTVEPPRARPRRMKQLERGELQPGGELDLHGLNRDEALARTRAFMAHAARQGWPVVLLVTGKGLHSSDGPVLRRAVERLLAETRELVLEWGEAPRRFGGRGALAVFLRNVKSDM